MKKIKNIAYYCWSSFLWACYFGLLIHTYQLFKQKDIGTIVIIYLSIIATCIALAAICFQYSQVVESSKEISVLTGKYFLISVTYLIFSITIISTLFVLEKILLFDGKYFVVVFVTLFAVKIVDHFTKAIILLQKLFFTEEI